MCKTRFRLVACVLILSLALFFSCAKEEEDMLTEETAELGSVEESGYVSEDISFGVYFDEEGTKRTIELQKDVEELKIYIIVQFPAYMEITAVDWRLALPKGLELESDKFYAKRNMTLGTFDFGISERFPCTPGPKLMLHTFTLKVTGELKNAEIAAMPNMKSNFLGVAECVEGFPMIRGAAFKAVINPE